VWSVSPPPHPPSPVSVSPCASPVRLLLTWGWTGPGGTDNTAADTHADVWSQLLQLHTLLCPVCNLYLLLIPLHTLVAAALNFVSRAAGACLPERTLFKHPPLTCRYVTTGVAPTLRASSSGVCSHLSLTDTSAHPTSSRMRTCRKGGWGGGGGEQAHTSAYPACRRGGGGERTHQHSPPPEGCAPAGKGVGWVGGEKAAGTQISTPSLGGGAHTQQRTTTPHAQTRCHMTMTTRTSRTLQGVWADTLAINYNDSRTRTATQAGCVDTAVADQWMQSDQNQVGAADRTGYVHLTAGRLPSAAAMCRAVRLS
jgi:hypothetical protein